MVTTGYFRTMSIACCAGELRRSNARGKPLVAIINETLCRKFCPGGGRDWPAVPGRKIPGKMIGPRSLELSGMSVPTPRWTLSLRRASTFRTPSFPATAGRNDSSSNAAKTKGGAASPAESTLRLEMMTIDPGLPMANYRTMEALVSNAVARPKFGSLLLGLFAATALLLTVVGLYGVVAYTVSQRMRELGIRIVLGAQPGEVRRMVVLQGMRPALVGLVLGLAAALGLSRFLASMLFEINATDPATFIVASVVLFGVAVMACWLPARRAARVDPMEALRSE